MASLFMLELSDSELNYLAKLLGIDIGWQRKRGNDANARIAESIYFKLKRLKGNRKARMIGFQEQLDFVQKEVKCVRKK